MSKPLVGVLAAAIGLSLLGCAPTATSPEVSEALALRTAQLAQLANELGVANPPATDLVRWVTPEEARDAWVDCLTEAGFTVAPEGVADIDLGTADAESVWICKARYTLDPRVTRQLGSGELSIVYRYFVDVQVPCLEERGFAIEEAEPEVQFKPHYYSDHPWVPYDSVPVDSLSVEELAELIAACPVNPPFEELYGEPLPTG